MCIRDRVCSSMLRLVGTLTWLASMISLCRSGSWLHGSDESTHEFALDLWGNGIHINALADQECSCVLDVVNSGRFNIDRFKSCRCELFGIFRVSERPRDAPNPQQHVEPYDRGNLAARHHVGHSETAPRFQHSKRFFQHTVLVS